MAKKVTMQQIADYLGVSKFAVSKALSGKTGVSEDTRERIYKAANELGYFSQKPGKPEQMPIKPKTASSGVIVVLFPDIRYQTQESSYWAPIVEGVTQELKANGLDMVALTEISGDSALRIINTANMDGIISVGPVSNTLLAELGQWGIPIVCIDNEPSEVEADCLFVNNFDAVRQLTDQLIGLGHGSFQFVGDIHFAKSFYDRWLGFRAALDDHGIPFSPDQRLLRLTENSFHRPEELVEAVSGLMERKELPSVFVCACDKYAMMTIEAMRQLGLNAPSDCSVTGFDNIVESAKVSPKLTTVNVPKQWLGIRAVQMMIWRTRYERTPPEKIFLPAEIVFRESTSLPAIKNNR
ncbi:LacI family DNA-binding transcriptional regulator [Paenibacillus thermotolerans]|uniref:LacI family DNA-binding transcriptional regulator n=1 Tax=Paenibacillus thermotolerans TaxID=3027807 RepID=UPI0023684FA4|nr:MULTISPECIES: substrate-binding domain-containing protein [unclassified Paenibacillus]